MLEAIDRVPWALAIILCLTLGLAPFAPPHLFEKLDMLFRGELKRGLDWFDLLLHGAPWLFLITKTLATVFRA